MPGTQRAPQECLFLSSCWAMRSPHPAQGSEVRDVESPEPEPGGGGRLGGGASPTSPCSLTAVTGWPRRLPSGRVSVEAALKGMRRRRNFSVAWEEHSKQVKAIPSNRGSQPSFPSQPFFFFFSFFLFF